RDFLESIERWLFSASFDVSKIGRTDSSRGGDRLLGQLPSVPPLGDAAPQRTIEVGHHGPSEHGGCPMDHSPLDNHIECTDKKSSVKETKADRPTWPRRRAVLRSSR